MLGLVFQNKMRSFRKLFLILSGRHEKGKLGRWADRLIQRKTIYLRKRKRKGCSFVVLILGLGIRAMGMIFR